MDLSFPELITAKGSFQPWNFSLGLQIIYSQSVSFLPLDLEEQHLAYVKSIKRHHGHSTWLSIVSSPKFTAAVHTNLNASITMLILPIDQGCKVTAHDLRPITNLSVSPNLFTLNGDISSEESIRS